MNDKLIIALNEFVHVGGSLVVIIAIVSVLTGIMREYIPQDALQQKLTKHEKWGSLLGAAFGMLTPFCSASVIPVTMGMASVGASLGTIMSFILSAPLCNFIVLAMIYATFGLKITFVYFVITFTAAILGGWLISKSPWRNEIKRGDELEGTKVKTCSDSKTSSDCSNDNASSSRSAPTQPSSCGGAVNPEASRIQNAMQGAWSLFKRIIPYVLLGAVISAFSAAYLPAELVEKYVGGDSFVSVIVAAFVGVPLYLRIEMAIPLLNVLIAKGMGLGAALALIIGGTGASLPEIAIVSSVLKPKAVIAFVTIVLTTAIVGGAIFQYVV
ncbi:permease [Shewanella intestini]|uniref:Permease n=1 Tax=Shewanella intestini TaxID=2017544 RepID=A0ABS5HZH2_9GAMM|nr:permease [Shewanella sp. XMDDZSB0408]MBR9727156.1 permease [Shewanella intestini]MRG35958.1 permease [Shewanella sp. XMDDZSB0408]